MLLQPLLHQCEQRSRGFHWMQGRVVSWQDGPCWSVLRVPPLQRPQSLHFRSARQDIGFKDQNTIPMLGGLNNGNKWKKCTSSQEHIIVHTNCSRNHAAKAHTRKDVAIVGLQINHRSQHEEAESTNIYHWIHLKQCTKICKEWHINHTNTVQTTLMHYWHSNDLNIVPGQQHIPFPHKSQEQTDFHLQRCTFPAQNEKK